MAAATDQSDHVTPEQRAAWPAVIVSMPFMHIDRPSIQLGLLKAIGEAHGFPVRTLHANLDFAARIGVDYYRLLAEQRGRLVSIQLWGVVVWPGHGVWSGWWRICSPPVHPSRTGPARPAGEFR